jgi:hypothetical protein
VEEEVAVIEADEVVELREEPAEAEEVRLSFCAEDFFQESFSRFNRKINPFLVSFVAFPSLLV